MADGFYSPNSAPNFGNTPTMPSYTDYVNWVNQQRQMQMQAMQQQQAMQVKGRIVNSENEITVKDVSMDGFTFFPQNDESCIYVKHWTNNGIMTRRYVPEPDPTEVKQNQQDNFNASVTTALNDMSSRLERIEKVISANYSFAMGGGNQCSVTAIPVTPTKE